MKERESCCRRTVLYGRTEQSEREIDLAVNEKEKEKASASVENFTLPLRLLRLQL